MKSDLKALQISDAEIERFSGFEVSPIFVGSVLGGVYRSSIFKKPGRLFSLALTELIVSALVFTLTLPVGLFATRNSAAQGIQDPIMILKFLAVTLGLTVAIVIGWNLYMTWRGKSLQSLMHLLDEVDRYHEVLDAIALLDQLETAGHSPIHADDRAEMLEALRLTRDSLVAGLMTEKILRESRSLMARRHELIAGIENNLTLLKTMEMHHEADDYAQFLNEALKIGASVHQAVRSLSDK